MLNLTNRDKLVAESIAKNPDGNVDFIEAQASLTILGYNIGSKGIDGQKGIDTAGAIKEFQLAMGLESTGEVDEKTKSAMTKAVLKGLKRDGVNKTAIALGRGAEDISDKGVQFIAAYEGYSERVYMDTAGRYAIGYGHSLKKGESFPDGITEDKALSLMKSDLENAIKTVKQKIAVPLTQEQLDALVSLAFNVGQIGEDLANAINQGKYSEVEARFKAYKYVGDWEHPGLVSRRTDEWDLYVEGDYERDL